MNTVQFIPESMRLLPCWVLWKLEPRKGHLSKVPYIPGTSYRASSTNPDTWTTYQTAAETLNSMRKYFSGVGFVLTKESGIVFIDCDHCIDEAGNVNAQGQDIMHALGRSAYMEISQSGGGLHAFVCGTIPRSFKNSKYGVEMYDHARFAAMTGNALQAVEPAQNQQAIDYLFKMYATQDAPAVPGTVTGSDMALYGGSSTLTDADVIDYASNAPESGNRFQQLFEGNLCSYNSQSEADLALCQLLAFWSDRDGEQIDRIFRQSGLMRDKWERRGDYRAHTINKACASITESFTEWKKRKREEENRSYARAILKE